MTINSIIQMLGGKKYIKKSVSNRLDLLNLRFNGISNGALLNLAQNLRISEKELVGLLPVSLRTYQRHKKSNYLNPLLSDYAIQLAELAARGQEIFEDMDKFRLWLHQPSAALGSVAPVTLLNTTIGILLVMEELGRIEHGILA